MHVPCSSMGTQLLRDYVDLDDADSQNMLLHEMYYFISSQSDFIILYMTICHYIYVYAHIMYIIYMYIYIHYVYMLISYLRGTPLLEAHHVTKLFASKFCTLPTDIGSQYCSIQDGMLALVLIKLL